MLNTVILTTTVAGFIAGVRDCREQGDSAGDYLRGRQGRRHPHTHAGGPHKVEYAQNNIFVTQNSGHF